MALDPLCKMEVDKNTTIIPPFHLGPLHINMYGIMFAAGTYLAIHLAVREARRRDIHPDLIYDLSLYLMIGMLVGARLFFVLFYWPREIPFQFIDTFKVWQGGMAFFGGFLGAATAGLLFVRRHNLRFLEYADIFTIPLVAGHIIGRIGDYLTGGHPGKPTELPWAVAMDNALRHPVVLYEIIGLVIILGILTWLRKTLIAARSAPHARSTAHHSNTAPSAHHHLQTRHGNLFFFYIILYSIQRMILDYFRLETTDPRWLGLTPSQFTVIALFLTASIALWRQRAGHLPQPIQKGTSGDQTP